MGPLRPEDYQQESDSGIREKHSDAPASLAIWVREVEGAGWKNTADLKATFKDADLVGDRVVFNIARNRYRLIAWVSYTTHKVFIKAILTHKEYDKELWKA